MVGPQGYQGAIAAGIQGAQGVQGAAGADGGPIQAVLNSVNTTQGEDIIFSSGSEIKSDGPLIINYASSLNGRSSGDSRGTNAVDLQNSASSITQVASGNYSTISGGSNNTASGAYSIVVGGDSNTASGNQSVIIGSTNASSCVGSILIGRGNLNQISGSASYNILIGDNNNSAANAGPDNITIGSDNICGGGAITVTGCMAIGNSNTSAAGLYGGVYARTVAVGVNNSLTGYTAGALGFGNISSWFRSFSIGTNCSSSSLQTLAIGDSNISTNSGSLALGGQSNEARGDYSRVSGYQTKSTVYGEDAFGTGSFSQVGDARFSEMFLRITTTNNTATKMAGDGVVGNNRQYTLEAGSMIKFTGQVVAKNVTTNQVSGWDIKGSAKRVGSTVTVVGATVTANASNEFAGTVQVVADSAWNSVSIQVTGITGNQIKWVGILTAARVL